METKRSLGQVSLTYGVITGIGLVLYSLLLYSLDAQGEKFVSLLGYVILIAGMIMGALNYRNKDMGGFMSYSQSLGITFLVGLFASIVAGIYTYLFFEFFAPEQIEVILRRVEEEMWKSNQNLSDERFEMAMEYTKKFTTPLWLAIGSWFSNTAGALITGLIASIFLKKEDDSFNATFKQEN